MSTTCRRSYASGWRLVGRDVSAAVLRPAAGRTFAVLYSTVDSRPNVPVNVLVSLDTLKGGFGWSDDELYDKFCYDLQVRYAVGYDNLGDGQFELRTLYNFRRRVSEYNQAHGVNLLQVAFVDITDQQITAFKVHTGQQRMDSTQIASNMLDMSRLHLLVEAVRRLQRLLTPAEQAHYAELLAPYLAGSAGHYVYRVKGRAATDAHLLAVGQVLYRLLTELAQSYGQEPVYQVVQRLFADNFRLAAEVVQPKANAEISAGCLQSLDDQEASYRRKDDQDYKGYVANLSETCDPANPLQLITHVQWRPTTSTMPCCSARRCPRSRPACRLIHCTPMAAMAARRPTKSCCTTK